MSFIPFAPAIPGVTIILVGQGITARDGLVLVVAMLLMGGRGVAWIAVLLTGPQIATPNTASPRGD